MGGCLSTHTSYIATSEGGEREYNERFLESKTLGQGEFGVVKLAHDVKNKDLIGAKPLAVKYLRKGFTFKDNTLYTPLKKEVLQGEVEILRRLGGECYNLKLVAVYESPSMIYMVTEFCEGGEMMPWVSTAFKDTRGLRTEDVSRISYQLWSAVDHCAKHKVIHRDIKPENVMFCTKERESELRLIDYGSGRLNDLESSENNEGNQSNGEVDRHHTFAGSAFYISPEMFQRKYTSKTDVWSAGATLYVLVAGYPADRLQEAFNVLQGTKGGRLRDLPNLPDNMPESFYEMLEGALVYRHKGRKDAGQLMNCEFSQFHIHHKELEQSGKTGTISIHEIAAEAAGDNVPEMVGHSGSGSLTRTKSVILEGSVSRHNAYLGYQKFERILTALLATMLKKESSTELLLRLRGQTEKKEDDDKANASGGGSERKSNVGKLQVTKVKVLLEVLGDMQGDDVKDVISRVKALENFNLYENFAYHISLLRQFVSLQAQTDFDENQGKKETLSVHGNNVWNSLKKKRGLDTSGTKEDLSCSKSLASGMRRVSSVGNLSSHDTHHTRGMKKMESAM